MPKGESLAPLRSHAEAVEKAAEELARQLRHWVRNEAVQPDLVSEKEHQADEIKREIRIQVAKARWLPLPKEGLLGLLWHQDEIADLCQDAALLMSQRRPPLTIELEDGFRALGELLEKTVHSYTQIVDVFGEALTARTLAAKAKDLVSGIDLVNLLEHEADLVERGIVATVYRLEELPPFDRYHLIQMVLMLGGVVDQVENAAGDIRVLLARVLR